MKKGLLGSTALVGATALMAGAASAAEAPEWKLSGNVNFQAYFTDQDFVLKVTSTLSNGTKVTQSITNIEATGLYFGVDEAELQLNVSGSTDNGLDYGFKIELNANTSDSSAADEARLSLGGSWGTLHLGDEDGAEDTMNYGGENLMGATGGFDGDQDDWYVNIGGANSFPTIAGDTSDSTKITYYSPRFSGLQVGGSWTPNPGAGGDPAGPGGTVAGQNDTSLFQNHIGLGVNYDGEFGGMRVRGSAVYSMASVEGTVNVGTGIEDIGAFSVGGIVNFGQIAVGANYTDNGESATIVGSNTETSYWNVAASFSQGPLSAAIGYMSSILEAGPLENTYDHLALTVDYSLAPGLSVYGEVASISSEIGPGPGGTNDGTGITLGANVSF